MQASSLRYSYTIKECHSLIICSTSFWRNSSLPLSLYLPSSSANQSLFLISFNHFTPHPHPQRIYLPVFSISNSDHFFLLLAKENKIWNKVWEEKMCEKSFYQLTVSDDVIDHFSYRCVKLHCALFHVNWNVSKLLLFIKINTSVPFRWFRLWLLNINGQVPSTTNNNPVIRINNWHCTFQQIC